VNLSVTFPDGWTQVAPDAFTYGPEVLYIDPTGGPTIGGTQVQILGYGFSFDPALIQVTVGGKSATVTGVDSTSSIIVPYPFPLFRLRITLPPNSAGNADLTITTPAGSTTVPRAFQYVSRLKVAARSGQFAQVVFDSRRQRAYVSNPSANRIEVLSSDTGQFLDPFQVGNTPLGLALTPDGSRLLVTNFGDKTLTLLDPDKPNQAIAVPIVDPADTNFDPRPVAVAATSTGKAFVGITRNLIGCGIGVLREIDLVTKAVTTRSDSKIQCLSEQIVLAASPDGTQMLVGIGDNSGGEISVWNAATD